MIAEMTATIENGILKPDAALPSARIFNRSFRLRERHSLSHWDSLLIAACLEAGITRLYSEDMQHGANYDGVEIVSPLI